MTDMGDAGDIIYSLASEFELQMVCSSFKVVFDLES